MTEPDLPGDPDRPDATEGAGSGAVPEEASASAGEPHADGQKSPSAISRAAGAAAGVAGAAVGAAGGAVRTSWSGTIAFWGGSRCVVTGVGRLMATPHLWPYGIMPVAIAIFVFVGTTYWAVDWLVPISRDFAQAYLGEWGGIIATIITFAVLVAAAIFAAYVAFPAIVRVVAAPFLALLSDRVFEDVAGMPAPTPPGNRFVRWVIRPIYEALVLLVIRLAITVVALPLLCIPVLGAPLFFAVMLPLEGMDLLDLAMSARAVPLGERLRFVRQHVPATAGLGLGAAGVLFVPLVNAFFLPALVVGAVLLDQKVSPDFPVAPQTDPQQPGEPSEGAST